MRWEHQPDRWHFLRVHVQEQIPVLKQKRHLEAIVDRIHKAVRIDDDGIVRHRHAAVLVNVLFQTPHDVAQQLGNSQRSLFYNSY